MNESDHDDIDTIPSQASLMNHSNSEHPTVPIDLKEDVAGINSPVPSSPPESIPEDESIFSIGRVFKNLFVLSLALVLLFTAYTNVLTLQSSLNVQKNVGINSLIINTVFVIVRCLPTLITFLEKVFSVQFDLHHWLLFGHFWIEMEHCFGRGGPCSLYCRQHSSTSIVDVHQ